MSASLEALQHRARPGELSSLRRLEHDLVREGWRVEGKTPREWLAELVLLSTPEYGKPQPGEMLVEAGLAAVPSLVDALVTQHLDLEGKRDTRIRLECVQALARIQPAPTCAIPALLKTLHSPSARLRRETLWTLGEFRPRVTPLAVRELLACLGHKQDSGTRALAARTLSRLEGPLPSEVRLAVLAHLSDPEAHVRQQCLKVLERLPAPDPEVRTALEEQAILDDANRLEALRILVRFDAPRALALLAEELRRVDQHPQRRAGIEQGARLLQLIAALGARAEGLLPVVCGLTSPPLVELPGMTAVDAILREQHFSRAPPLPQPPFEDERARRLTNPLPDPEPGEAPSRTLARWAERLLPHGRELCVRMALAAARHVVGLWDLHASSLSSPRSAVFALEDWLLEPSEDTARRAVLEGDHTPSQLLAPEAFSAGWAVRFATCCVAAPEQLEGWTRPPEPLEVAGGYLGSALHSACRALQGGSVITLALGAVGSGEEPSRLSPAESVERVRRAIVDEVLPWVLGVWDPVLEVRRHRQELLTELRFRA